jgi:hypothetical protein
MRAMRRPERCIISQTMRVDPTTVRARGVCCAFRRAYPARAGIRRGAGAGPEPPPPAADPPARSRHTAEPTSDVRRRGGRPPGSFE